VAVTTVQCCPNSRGASVVVSCVILSNAANDSAVHSFLECARLNEKCSNPLYFFVLSVVIMVRTLFFPLCVPSLRGKEVSLSNVKCAVMKVRTIFWRVMQTVINQCRGWFNLVLSAVMLVRTIFFPACRPSLSWIDWLQYFRPDMVSYRY